MQTLAGESSKETPKKFPHAVKQQAVMVVAKFVSKRIVRES
jgi:hypothetical protein